MELNKNINRIACLILFIVLIGNISAFGIGGAYHADRPLEMTAGESTEIIFNVDNVGGASDINVKGNIIKGSEIIKFSDKENIYSIPLGSSIDVGFNVTVPSDAEIGYIYPLEVGFITVSEEGSGTFSFGSSVSRSFNLIVVPTLEQAVKIEKQKKLVKWLIIGIVILVVLILLVLFLVKRKK